MLPACRTASERFAIPTFDLVPSDVEGFLEELWEFPSAFHDCFARSELRAHFFDYMVGQLNQRERKSIEPMALQVAGGTIRGLQRFLSAVHWDEESPALATDSLIEINSGVLLRHRASVPLLYPCLVSTAPGGPGNRWR
jgi:hypothetical protein